METTTPFDLNQAIQRWREGFAQSPAFQRDNVDEMETHLRDSMASLQSRGLSEAEAFQIASQRLGGVEQLHAEFAKTNASTAWRQRAFWMLAGILFWTVSKGVIGVVSSGAVYAGSWFTNDGLLLGWLGGGMHLLSFAFVVVAFWRLANGRFAGSNNLGGQVRNYPVRFVGCIVIGMLFLASVSGGLSALTFHRLDTTIIGQQFLVKAWFTAPIRLLQLAALIGGLVWLIRGPWRRASRSRLASGLLIASIATGLSLAPVAAQDPGNTNRIANPKPAFATLADAMQLWRDGKQYAAAEKFMTVDFSKRPLFPKGSVLNLTEAEFIALPGAARDKMSKAMFDDIQTIKLIAGQVKELAKTPGKSAPCLSQLKAAGEAFDRPGGLALLKLVGQAFKKMAAAQP